MSVVTEIYKLQNQIIHPMQTTLLYTQSLIGDYKYSARTLDTLGWLVCDGRVLDRVIYASLFDVVGTSFGSTNSANFKLPDFRGRVFASVGQGNLLTNRTLGTALGAETHTLSVNEMPSHNHGGATGNSSAGSYDTQTISAAGGGGLTANDEGSHSHTIASQGGDQPHNIMQPTLFGGNVFIFGGIVDNILENLLDD